MPKYRLLEKSYVRPIGQSEAQAHDAGAVVDTLDVPGNSFVPLDESAAVAKATAISERSRSGIRVASSNQYRRVIARSLGFFALSPDEQIAKIETWLKEPTPIVYRRKDFENA